MLLIKHFTLSYFIGIILTLSLLHKGAVSTNIQLNTFCEHCEHFMSARPNICDDFLRSAHENLLYWDALRMILLATHNWTHHAGLRAWKLYQHHWPFVRGIHWSSGLIELGWFIFIYSVKCWVHSFDSKGGWPGFIPILYLCHFN